MTPSKSTTVDDLLGPGDSGRVSSARAGREAALAGQLCLAGAALGSTGSGWRDSALDEVAGRLHRVEDLLGELAREAGVTAAAARQLRGLRDQVSVYLSAAASLRLLDLDAKAAAVLRRAVMLIRARITDLGHPNHTVAFCDTE